MKGPIEPDELNRQLLKFWLGPFFGVLYRLDGVWLQTFSDILGTFLVSPFEPGHFGSCQTILFLQLDF